MLAQEGFVALLNEAEQEIRDSMKSAIRKHARAMRAGVEAAAGVPGPSTVTVVAQRDTEDGDSEVEEDDEDDVDDMPPANRPALRVGVSCVKGRHRSVAFVEELSAKNWPAEWEVRVKHRDLDKPRVDKERWRKDARAPRFKSFAVDSENE